MEIIRAHHLDNLVALRALKITEFARGFPEVLLAEEKRSPGYLRDLWGKSWDKDKFVVGAVATWSRTLSKPGDEDAIVCQCEDGVCKLAEVGRHCKVGGGSDQEAIDTLLDVVELNPFLVFGVLRLDHFGEQEAVFTNMYTVRRLINYMIETGQYFCKYHD